MRETRLSESASFSIEDGADHAHKKIKFTLDDPDETYQSMLLVLLKLGRDAIENVMQYDKEKKQWVVEIERPENWNEKFLISPNVTPEDDLATKKNTTPLASGFIVLKNGVQQAVNKTPGIPAGELKKFLYTADGKIADPVDEKELKEGERLITIYFPPGYDENKKPPYNFQVTLDGRQYLETMQMNVIFDNLIASREIEPVVNVFISPFTGAPDPTKERFFNVVPEGYTRQSRYKEYACNPEFAEKLSHLPDTLREQFNVTNDPNHTTIWGVSMGGLQAEYTALTHPEVFANVVAQSPMAWNIPTHLSDDDWRAQITDDWQSATAMLPPIQEHNEYVTQAVLSGSDDGISGRPIAQSASQKLKFYFDAGEREREYDPDEGSANLVESTRLFAEALTKKGHDVVANVVTQGGHDEETWMSNIADAARAMHRPALQLASEAEANATKNERASLLASPTSFFGKSFSQALQAPRLSATTSEEDDKKPKL